MSDGRRYERGIQRRVTCDSVGLTPASPPTLRFARGLAEPRCSSGFQQDAGVNVPARRPSPVCVRGAHAPDFHTQGMSFSWLLCTQCNVGTERAPTTADPPSATAGFGLPPSSLSSPGSHRVPLPWPNEKKRGSPAMCGGQPGLPSPAWSAAARRRALPPSSLGGTSPSAGVGGRYCRKRLSTRETSLALRLASSSEAAFFQRGKRTDPQQGCRVPSRPDQTDACRISERRARPVLPAAALHGACLTLTFSPRLSLPVLPASAQSWCREVASSERGSLSV